MSSDLSLTTNPHGPTETQRRLARRRAAAKLGFLIHLVVFVIVNTGLVLLDALALRRHGFSVFPLLGWGLGLTIHGLVVGFGAAGANLREKMEAAELERLVQRR